MKFLKKLLRKWRAFRNRIPDKGFNIWTYYPAKQDRLPCGRHVIEIRVRANNSNEAHKIFDRMEFKDKI